MLLQSWLLLSLLGDDGGIGAEGLAQQLVRLLDAASHDPAGERPGVTRFQGCEPVVFWRL
jgi:hypothetical protein